CARWLSSGWLSVRFDVW
nr:immunoglobulin heavy chain junction region [Macaca mulatta]MOV53378.1 immunoglobulin heavy chain junction region [Macaca mulatta]MOV53897.1 immunoglobulin heavy chain junction region [Macaca mulatta]MOV54039.1 immunoglobulin heavy chain junction region [Macaca mulatta]MOV54111.1 immunoglobulin heavy chain junction region [Macaca mulatta]